MADEKQKEPEEGRGKQSQPATGSKARREPEDRQAAVSRYAADEHITMSRGMYGVPRHVVSAALALIQTREDGNVRDGYSKDEVKSAIADLANTEVQTEES